MAIQKFTHLSSKSLVKALGTLTLNTITNAAVIAVPLDVAMFVYTKITLTGNVTITVTGNTAADGSGTHTVIKTLVSASSVTDAALEVDSSEISYAEQQAGATFLSVCFRITGTATDTIRAAYQVKTLREYEDQTPTGPGTVA